MEQLLWYSIPGAVLGLPIACIRPEIFSSSSHSIIAVVLLPVIGFIFHQFFCLCFERTGGFARKSRKSLDCIKKELTRQENAEDLDQNRAFLVWEITFYGKEFPAAFFDHDRRCWHYILSFWSIALAAFVVFALVTLSLLFHVANYPLFLLALVELILSLVFYLKGKSTYDNLIRQEIAVFRRHKELFQDTLDSIE